MSKITDEEWQRLSLDPFDTMTLLYAVDDVDELRVFLNDGEHRSPPRLRTELLQLHQLAMAVFNEGWRDKVGDLFDLAVDLDDQVSDMMTVLERIRETLSRLRAQYPEILAYGEDDDDG